MPPRYVTEADDPPKAVSEPEMFGVEMLSAVLDIETSMPPVQHGDLLNEFQYKDAEIISSKMFWPNQFTQDDLVPLSEEDMDKCAFFKKSLTLTSAYGGDYEQTFNAPNKKWFSVRDFFVAVAEMEGNARKHSDWFGGIDTHHVYFEGTTKKGKKLVINWGS